jgi:hypothetical protein
MDQDKNALNKSTILRKVKWTALFILCIAASLKGTAANKELYVQGFEDKTSMRSIKIDLSNSAATAERVSPGQLSNFSLQVDKPDTCGYCIVSTEMKVPEASRGKWLKVSADIKTVYKGVYAEYLLMVTELKNGKRIGKNQFFPYDDGITRQNLFGGMYKTPQTLDEWRKTIHQFKANPEADSLKLSFITRKGSQTLLLDNIKVEDIGDKAEAAQRNLVYEKNINWPYGMLDVDTLLPGAVYDIEVDCIWPAPAAKLKNGLSNNAKKSAVITPDDSSGMGISMVAVDFQGNPGKKVQLEERPDISKTRKVFRVVVPENAVKLLFDFHNDDLVRFDHNQIETQARRWGTVRIHQHTLGEIAADNAYWQYLYRNKPPHLKVRDFVDLKKFDLDVLKAKLAKRPESSLRPVKHKGGMCLKLNDKLVPPMLMSGVEGTSHYKLFSEAAKHGMNLLICRYPYGGPVMHGDWQAEGKYDFRDLDTYIYKVLSQNPDASIILSIDQVYAPDWWTVENKDALVRSQDGSYVRCLNLNLYKRAFGSFPELEKIRKRINAGKSAYKLRGAESIGFYVPSTASEKYASLTARRLPVTASYGDMTDNGASCAMITVTAAKNRNLSITANRCRNISENG